MRAPDLEGVGLGDDGGADVTLALTRRDVVLLHTLLRREVLRQLGGARKRDAARGSPWPGLGDRGLTRLQSSWELYADLGGYLDGDAEAETRCRAQQAHLAGLVRGYVAEVAGWRRQAGLPTWFIWPDLAPGVDLGSPSERAAEAARARGERP